MKRWAFTAVGLLLATITLHAADEVEITGTYQLQVSCHSTYHEEISFIVEPGKDKFSGIQHAIHIPKLMRNGLRPGVKIRIKGKKQAAVKQTMTKADVRKAMYMHLETKVGMPLYCKDMGTIIGKISVKPSAADAHNHGKLEIKPVDDDAELVEVVTASHIVVETIEILK